MKKELSGSEALFGFCAWLTCRDEEVVIGAGHDCAPICDLVKIFCDENHLSEPRDEWATHLIHPSGEVAVAEE